MNNLVQILQDGQSVWYLMLVVSFFGGVIASLSPCSLSMLPLVIGYIGGYSKTSNTKALIQLLFFIFGTAVVFTTIGVLCALTGQVFAPVFGAYFTIAIASFLLVLGLKLINVLDIELPAIIKKMPNNNSNSLFLYPFFIGVLFALAGTPCSTPILAGIMAFTAMGKNLLMAVLMLFLFALGQGCILIIAGIFTSGIKNLNNFSKYSDYLVKISGILLILASLYMYWRVFRPLF